LPKSIGQAAPSIHVGDTTEQVLLYTNWPTFLRARSRNVTSLCVVGRPRRVYHRWLNRERARSRARKK